MVMARAQANPVLVGTDNAMVALERIHLGAGLHSEDWLQQLIHDHPQILPMGDIEPGFGELVAAAREVPCGHGLIDNLYITPVGDIVLVETKLWRNSEIRREVVAQALDYVAALTAMSYSAFEAAVVRGDHAPARLYDLVADRGDALEEADFIDAVSRNLARGRMVVIVLGDGIRTETEALSELLQSHAGAHFTFALVEIGTWRNGAGEILAVPSTLAKTVMIERGIVRIESGGIQVEPVPAEEQARPQSITMQDFWEAMAARNPDLPRSIRSFLDALEPLGIYPDLKASLNIKADLPERTKPVNFGYITKSGQFWTNPAAWNVPDHIWKPYFEAVASFVGGTVINEPANKYVALAGSRSAPRIEQLLPAHQNAWTAAIAKMLRELGDEQS